MKKKTYHPIVKNDHCRSLLHTLAEDDKDGDEDEDEAWEMSQSGQCPVESIAVSTLSVQLPTCDNVQQCSTVLRMYALSYVHHT